MALDISAVGSKFSITGGGMNLTVTEWSDEGTPFDCPDIDISENRKNLNGTMISSRTPSVIPVSITVIPGSVSDKILLKHFAKWTISPGKSKPIGNSGDNPYVQAVLSIPTIVAMGAGKSEVAGARTYKFFNGRAKSYSAGPSTSSEGRLASRTYTFEFEMVEPE